MPKLVPIKFKKFVKILEILGFRIVRVKGSHHRFEHSDGLSTTVPFKNKELGVGLLRQILRDIEVSVERYEEMRKVV